MKNLELKLRTLVLVLAALMVTGSANYAICQDKSIKFPKPAKKENTTKQQSTNTSKNKSKKSTTTTKTNTKKTTNTTTKDNNNSSNDTNYGELAEKAYDVANYADAVKYGELGAAQNDAQAINVLGYCYFLGQGVSKDIEKAVSYFRKAANQNYSSAQYMLGECYRRGSGVTGNWSTARQWYAKVIENPGSGDWIIGYAKEGYQECNNGVPYSGNSNYSYNNNINYGEYAGKTYDVANYADAVKYGELGAAQNDAKAMTILGNCYLEGRGVSEDENKAVSYYQKAVKQKYWEAEFQLGLCYQLGLGVKENLATARKWYKKAIENPNTENWCIGLAKKYYQECNNDIPYRGK
jgi:TPR repeat protein